MNNNFKKIKYKNEEMTLLRSRFDKRGFSPMAYSKAYSIERTALTKLLKGELTGEKETKRSGAVRKAICQLKRDCVWIGRVPWEV